MKPPSQQNVEFVVERKLCTSCGACSGVCPVNAIRMEVDRFGIVTPSIDPTVCTNCRLCVQACPGWSFDYSLHQHRLHGGLPADGGLGHYQSLWAGYTNDAAILKRAQSGGIVSSVLTYLLEKGLIDGAVVTRRKKEDPLRTETLIVRNRAEVLEAVGSIYHPVPAVECLRQLIGIPGRYAFVGTSCQIQGMRKAAQVLGSRFPDIALYIGLHCLGVFTFHYQDQVLHKLGLARRDVGSFRFRDKAWRGWPCDMRVTDTSGRIFDLDADRSRLWPRWFFTNWRCFQCFDKANEFADLSCGDNRIPQMYEQLKQGGYDIRQGVSEVIVRTARGRDVIEQMVREKVLTLHPVSPGDITKSISGIEKKIGLRTFAQVARFFGAGVPEYGVEFDAPGGRRKRRITWLVASHYYVMFVLGQHRLFRSLLRHVPHRLLGMISCHVLERFVWREFRSPSCRVTVKNGLGPAMPLQAASGVAP